MHVVLEMFEWQEVKLDYGLAQHVPCSLLCHHT